MHYTPGHWGTHSGRPPEAFVGLRFTGVMKLVDQSLKSIETWNVVLSFLQMSPKPALTFSSAPYANRSSDWSFANGEFRRCLLFGKIRSAKMSGVYGFMEVNQDKITTTI